MYDACYLFYYHYLYCIKHLDILAMNLEVRKKESDAQASEAVSERGKTRKQI